MADDGVAGVVSDVATCDVGDFSMADVVVDEIIEADADPVETLTETGLLEFANSAVAQDDCKDAQITLNLVADDSNA